MTPIQRFGDEMRARGFRSVRGMWPCCALEHDDKKPSLSASEGSEGQLLLYCHAGCATEAVVAAIGWTMADLFPEKLSPNGRGPAVKVRPCVVATYRYVDEAGELLFEVVRYEPKGFKQRRPDGEGGWLWKLGDVRRVPYRLPEVLAAVAAGSTVFCCEGEKDCEAVEAAGGVGTTCPAGAGKWRAEYAAHFAGARVVVVAHRDETGRAHAGGVAASLAGVAAEVRVVEPVEGKDAYDHLAAGHGLEEFVPVVELDRVEEVRPAGFKVASSITRRTISWALGQRIPLAEVSALSGDGGAGKSTAAQEFAARVSRGQLGSLPGGSDLTEPRGVVILTTEEDPEAVVKPRLAAMGGDLDRILILSDSGDGDTPPLTLPSGADRLDQAVRFVDAALVVIDTGPSFLDPGLKSNTEEDVRRFYRPLSRIAREHRLVVLSICHLNKGDVIARHRVTGSAAWVNVPRSVLIMAPPPGEDPLETPERLLVVVKANLISGKMPDAIGAKLVSGRDDPTVGTIAWTGERAGIRAADLTTYMDADEHGEREECVVAIRDLLADGPRAAKECEAALKTAGHSVRTMRRAREALFVTRASKCVYQDGFRGPHMWKLPTDTPVADSTDGHRSTGQEPREDAVDPHR